MTSRVIDEEEVISEMTIGVTIGVIGEVTSIVTGDVPVR